MNNTVRFFKRLGKSVKKLPRKAAKLFFRLKSAWYRTEFLQNRYMEKIRLLMQKNGSTSLNLHLGCGTVYKEGWINIDNNSDSNIQKLDLNLDLRYPLPLPDNCADYIYNEHFLEHLTVEESRKALQEFMRVLKKGGTMRIAMPHIRGCMGFYFDENYNLEKSKKFLEKYGLDFIKTKAEYVNVNFRFWGHKWLYDEEELARRLTELGFSNFKFCTLYESEHELLKNMETRPESRLIAEVTKE